MSFYAETPQYSRIVFGSTRETPTEWSNPYHCAGCGEGCDADSLLGMCCLCEGWVCREHDRQSSSTRDGMLYCSQCAKVDGLANCEACDWLFPVSQMRDCGDHYLCVGCGVELLGTTRLGPEMETSVDVNVAAKRRA